MPKQYKCKICESKPDQLSHHKTHINTAKHKDKKSIFELTLKAMSKEELEKKYATYNITEIIKKFETKKIIKIKRVNLPMIISNKEALKDKIHDMHNYLRNNGGGYGMNALKVFNILYGLKKIEENNLIDLSNLTRPYCEFSHILKMANENKDEELAELIQSKILDSLSQSNIRAILFYEIPKNISGNVFSFLIKEIEQISNIEKATNTQLCGKIYEYFIGRDQTAISELGAYFTDRHITEFLYKEEPIILNSDSEVPSMCDPYGGSGGFTVGYLLYLKNKYATINWETEINKVHHYDMNEDVIKSAALEFFCITGRIPDMKSTLRYANSFTDEFSNKRFMKIFTNPPYGGDKNKTTQKQSKRKKVINYINEQLKTLTNEETIKQRKTQLKNIHDEEKYEKKIREKSKVTLSKASSRIQAFAKKYKLKGNDKESVSLIQLMDLVDINGTVVGVLKEGVFFNKKYKGLRECLIKNFNVRKVISIPSDQFENTATKTSALVFDNTENKTSVVEFSKIIVEHFSEDKFEEIAGQIICSEYSGEGSKLKADIKSVEKKIVSTTTAEEILANDTISFNGKDYIKDEIIPGDGYELKRLDEICEFSKGSGVVKENRIGGQYPYYASNGHINGSYMNKRNIKGEFILLAEDGTMGAKHFIKDTNHIYVGDHVHILRGINISNILIYSLLEQVNFPKYTTGSVIPKLNKRNLKRIICSIPKSPEKIQYWVDKISAPFNEKNEKQTLLKNLEQEVLDKVKFISENEDCEIFILDKLIKIIKPNFNLNTNDMDNNGLYPFYNKIGVNKGYHSVYNYDIEKGIMLTKDGGSGPGVYGNKISLGGCMIIKGKFAATYANFIMVPKNNNYNIDYIYNIMKLLKNKIMDMANYSVTIGHIKFGILKKLNIHIPKNKNLITELEPEFALIEQLKLDIQNAEARFEQYIQELGRESIKN